MVSLVVPNGGLLRLIWAQGGVPFAVNVMGFQNTQTTPVTQTLTNTVGAAIRTSFSSSGLNAQMGTQITLLSVGLRSINTASLPEFLDTGAPVAGTAVGNLLPPQTALVVTLRTGLAGRSFRGRVYLGGFAVSANGTAGAANAAVGTAAQAFIGAINNNLSTSGWQLAVVSRPAPDAIPPRPTGFVTPVTVPVVRDLVWDTQRKRARPGI